MAGQGGGGLPGIAAELRVQDLIASRTLSTAFQPIRDLSNGHVVGVEALTRFSGEPDRSPEEWFADAASSGCAAELEFLAMKTALNAAAELPNHLFVSVNLSPTACLDRRMVALLEESRVAPTRIVLELTEHCAVTDYESLKASLARAREAGLRIAVDDTGAGFASMRHVLQLRPDFIKLDRTIIAGLDADDAKKAFGSAMVKFAEGISATLVAEGLETMGELAAVMELGVPVGQGYLLGEPTVHPEEWSKWRNHYPQAAST